MFQEKELPVSRSEDTPGLPGPVPGSKSSPSIKPSIESVPPEILLHIFQAYVFDCRKAYKRYSRRSNPCTWFKILHICRLWREIALCETRLWTHVVPTVHPECAEYVISHAGARPISVDVPNLYSPYSEFASSVLRIMKELPRIATLSCSLQTWACLSPNSSVFTSLDAPILETLSLSAESLGEDVPQCKLEALPKLKTLVAERLSHKLLVNLARPTLTTLVLRDCTSKGQLILEILATLPALHSLSLQSDDELNTSSATHVSLRRLRKLQIVDHWLSYFCQNLSLSWNILRLEIIRDPFMTASNFPPLSDVNIIYRCLNSFLITPIRHANARSGLNIHFMPRRRAAASVMVAWGSEYPDKQATRSSFSFSLYSQSKNDPIAKLLKHFFTSISLPNTFRLSIDMTLPPTLWRCLSRTYLDKLEELHLSAHASRSFILACNTFNAPVLFPVLKTLQLTTGKFAVDTRKHSKPYDVLKNLEMALSSRKHKGLTLQVLRILYEGVLADDERSSLEAGGFAERLQIKEQGYRSGLSLAQVSRHELSSIV